MGKPFDDLIETLRQSCQMEDCPLALTVEDLATDVPPSLDWTKKVLARNALELSWRCGPGACCVRPYLERLCDMDVTQP